MERKANDMTKTIISSVVALICVAALCLTYALVGRNTSKNVDPESVSASASLSDDYLTEEEAAAYIGVTVDVMQMMRDKLGYFKGAYMVYIYLDAEGKEVKSIVYNREALDDAVATLSKDVGALSFKFLQEQK
ncbi:MAG: hypothetical protein J6L62_09190 [Clostridia bacterium]|nr:hypothetical protein [Clostridia bacterium]